MKQINSPHDLETALQSELAIVFVYFPWSTRSENSKKTVREWQRLVDVPGCYMFQLTPDQHPFSWQWLETIFGDATDEERTRGMLIWLRKGSVVGIVPDAGGRLELKLSRG